jgi:rubrerythrin
MSERTFRTVAEIIEFAIAREKEAAEAYGRMADGAVAPGLRELLLFLRGEEESHQRLLEGLTADQIGRFTPALVPDLVITDYLVEETLGRDMSLQDLLVFAAQKEKRAVDLYTMLARMASASGQARLFEFLAGQERAHKLKLEAAYEKHVMPEN